MQHVWVITHINLCGCYYLSKPQSRSWFNQSPWWRHQMETFSALLAICARNSPVTGEFPAQRPVTRSFDVFFDLRPNERLSKQSWDWWFETQSCPLWRRCKVVMHKGGHRKHRQRKISQRLAKFIPTLMSSQIFITSNKSRSFDISRASSTDRY